MGERLTRFFHAAAPPDAICLYRAGLGAIVAAVALHWLPHAAELFSSEGFHLGPLASCAPPPGVAPVLCALLACSGAAVAVGLFTRAALAATLGLWGYLQLIDTINEKANATVVLVALAVLLFSACDRKLSVDARRAARAGRPKPQGAVCVLPQRLLQLEIAQVYLFAGLVKLFERSWWTGETLAGALGSRWGTEAGVWIAGWVPGWLAAAASVAAMAFEVSAPALLLWPRTRRCAIALGVAFHLAIQATLHVGALGPHFILALAVLFPSPEAVARRMERLASRFSPPGA